MNFVRLLNLIAALVLVASLSGCDSGSHPAKQGAPAPRESAAAIVPGNKYVYRGLLQTDEGQTLSAVELTLDVDKITVMNFANFDGHLRAFTGDAKKAAISLEFGGQLTLGSTSSFDVTVPSMTYSGGRTAVRLQVKIEGDKLVGEISASKEITKLTTVKDAPLPKAPPNREIQTQFTGVIPAGAFKLPQHPTLSTPAQLSLSLGLLPGATDVVELANFVDRQLDMDVYLISNGVTLRLDFAKMNILNGNFQVKAKKSISDTETIDVSLKCAGTEDGGKDCTWTAGQAAPLGFHVVPLH